MSRLIVKNLPKTVTSDELKSIFCQKGEITDVQLKYTKNGMFRSFAFVGFRTEKQAEEAREYFHGSFVRSMRISVEKCAALGAEEKPRAWSKYAADSSAYQKNNKNKAKPVEGVIEKEKKHKKSEKFLDLIEKHKDDPQFAEFIEAHAKGGESIKEVLKIINNPKSSSIEDADKHQKEQPESVEKTEGKVDSIIQNKDENKIANKEISDLDYMKSLIKKNDTKDEKNDVPEKRKERDIQLYYVRLHTSHIRECKKKDIKEFFRPLVPFTIRMPSKTSYFCFVGFKTEQEQRKSLYKNKSFLVGKQAQVIACAVIEKEEKVEVGNNYSGRKTQEENIQHEESIGESGRIFVRNLPYVVNEDEVTELFQKYGPIAEIDMPIDRLLRQPKGFATVTFVLPENAVRAYSELDGSIFAGRMLHLLPGKSKDKDDEDNQDEEGLSFKEKKEKKLKASAKSSHNWNSLFLGANAIADVIAENYNTTKEQLLNDNNKNTSAAVRLALGETQLVAQTRSFLEEHGVCLDAFSQGHMKRSKTCILVKNLPAQTTGDELKPKFSNFGPLARFIMPRHGITALIEFVEPSEARNAFSKLAYSQFKNAPLYLEWAPQNVFTKPADSPPIEKTEIVNDRTQNNNANAVEAKTDVKYQKEMDKCEPQHSYSKPLENKRDIEYKKNETEMDINRYEGVTPEPNATLFIRNVNFKTFEESLKEHFKSCGPIYSVRIAKKKDPKNPGNMLSMGYGFVEFYTKKDSEKALKTMKFSVLDGNKLELKRSERTNTDEIKTTKKSTLARSQTGSKILVRNIPFQANKNEIHEIFRAFGEVKTLRLPLKLTQGTEQHRGFCFVDFHSNADAKTAFDALSHSTHLYGRRMALEWADQTDENEDVVALRKRTAQSFHQSMPGGKTFKKAVADFENFADENEQM